MDKKRVADPYFIKLNKRVRKISGAVLAPGYHFCPNDYELLTYLEKKNMEQDLDIVKEVISDFDVYNYKHLPGDLLNKHLAAGEQLYFFCPVKKKHAAGSRINRSTETGSWRITGQDRKFYDMMIRTLVFYDIEKKKTNWMMHEYRLEGNDLSEKKPTDSITEKVNYVLCKLFEKSEPNLKDGHQAGCSFRKKEKKDSSYTDEVVIVLNSLTWKPSDLESQTGNITALDESLMTSTANYNSSSNVLEFTDKGDLDAPDGLWLSDISDEAIINMNYFENGTCGSENMSNGLQGTRDTSKGLASVERNESTDHLYLQHESTFSKEPLITHMQKGLNAQPTDFLHMLTTSQEDGDLGLGYKNNTFLVPKNSQCIERKLMNFQSGDTNDDSYLHGTGTNQEMDISTIGNANPQLQASLDDTKVDLDPFPDTLWSSYGLQSPDIDLSDWEF